MADEQIQGVPAGLTAVPIQGVPSGLTAEPVQPQTAAGQIQGVPAGLTAVPISQTVQADSEKPGMLKGIWDKLNTGLVSKDTFVRALTGMTSEQLDKELAPYADETPTHAAFREFTRGTFQDIGATGSTFTSPLAVGTMAVGAAGKLPGAVGTIAKAATGLASAGFATAGAQDVIAAGTETTPEAWQQRLQGTGMAILGGTGAVESRSAFRTTKQAFDAAAKVHESAKQVFDQRMNEVDIATKQAEKAANDAHIARQSEELGSAPGDPQRAGNRQQTVQAEELASQAAANARKAQEALKQAGLARAEAGIEVDRIGRKLQKSATVATEKQTKSAVGAQEDFQKAIPSPASGPAKYSARDYQVGRRYLEQHHVNIEQVSSVQDTYDAFDHIQHDMENQVKPYVEKYANEAILTNVRMDVRDQLAENPRADFVEKGMVELEKYNLADPTVSEADDIRGQLTAENRAILKKNMWDVATALKVDPEFAARYAAVDSLRNGVYDAFEEKGVNGIRELRQDEASIIRLRNAAEKQLVKGGVKVRGSNQSGPYRKFFARILPTTGASAGAAIGGAAGHPVWGASIGERIGSKLGRVIVPDDLTRDALIKRSMTHQGGGVPVTEIEGPGTPATQFAGPGAIKRDLTPLHGDLATHYGENVIDAGYTDLEQRFREDLRDKQRHGVPLEPAEKALLGKINQQDAADALAAQQKAQDAAASGKSLTPEATLPEQVEPLLQAPISKLASGMDTERGIVHDIAHIVVGDERGIKFTDGIRSHLHSENINAGSLMSAPIDWDDFMGEEGNVDVNKIRTRIADLAATYVAGGVANDLYHDIPFTENHHLGADVSILKKFMKGAGFSEAEATKLIAQAADDAAQVLSRPGMQEILEQHAAVREGGLDVRYHVSPERMDQILDDVKGQHETTTGKPTGTAGAGERADKEAGAGAKAPVEERNQAELRPEGKGPAEREGKAVRGVEPAEPKLGAAGEDDELRSTYQVVDRNGDVMSTHTTRKGASRRADKLDSEYGGVRYSVKEVPSSPKLAVAEEPEDVESEHQVPLKRSYSMEITDQQGGTHNVEIQGFSGKQAIKTAQKKFPDAQEWAIRRETPGAAPTGYTVPEEKLLSVGGRAGEAKTDIQVLRHELGHVMLGMREGGTPKGILRHTHPDMESSGRAGVSWENTDWIDPDTRRAIPEKVPGLIRRLMGGIAADEAFNDIPRGQNHNLDITRHGSDGRSAATALKNIGMDAKTARETIHRAIDQGKQYLTKPEVSGIIKENEGVREPGLSRQYHYSPERLQQMHLEAQRRINAGTNNGPVGAEAGAGHPADVGAGEAAGAGRVSEGVREPEAGTTVGLTPESPKLSIPPERSTGDPEHDRAIKEGGGVPGGMLGRPEDQAHVKMFHDPQSGTTLGFRANEPVTAEAVRAKIAASRAEYRAGEQRNAVRQQLATHEATGGSTFTPQGENLAGKDLYAVGAYPERTLQVDKLTPEVLAKFKSDNRDVLGQPDHAVGTWKDPDTGKSVLDISKTHQNRDTAIAAGKLANQKAIYHLGGEGEIQTGGTGEPESPKLAAYHPDLQKIVDKFGTHEDPDKVAEPGASFVTPDGKYITLPGGLTHDAAVDWATGYPQVTKDIRVPFINDTGVARIRSSVDRAGNTMHISVPAGGVQPEQVDALKRAVASNGRNSNVVLERADITPETKDELSRTKEFATPKDVEPMLRQIGAHPEQDAGALKSPDDMLRAELKTELGVTRDDPRNGLPNKVLAKQLTAQRATPESPKLSPKGSSVPLMKNPLEIKGTGEEKRISTVDVAKALNQFTTKKIGALELGKAEPEEQVERAKKIAEDEAKYQLNQNNSGKAWYTTDIGVHDNALQQLRPELKDPAKMSIFKMNEAILSSGQSPYTNMKSAIKAWDYYNETGEFSGQNPDTGKSWGPRNVQSYAGATDSLNRLIKDKGEQGASDWLLAEHPVKELRQYMTEGQTPVRGKADDTAPGAMVLGAKRGPFAQNLHGIESAFTADMWVNRTWNRWMGTQEVQPDGELRDSPRNQAERQLMKQSFSETAEKLGLTTSSLQAVLWYYEQGLYDIHGSAKESWSFADVAKRIQQEHQAEETKQSQGRLFGEEPKTPAVPAGQVHALDFMKLLGGKK